MSGACCVKSTESADVEPDVRYQVTEVADEYGNALQGLHVEGNSDLATFLTILEQQVRKVLVRGESARARRRFFRKQAQTTFACKCVG